MSTYYALLFDDINNGLFNTEFSRISYFKDGDSLFEICMREK